MIWRIAVSAASASELSAERISSAIDCSPSRRISIAIRNARCAAAMSPGVSIRFACWYWVSAWLLKLATCDSRSPELGLRSRSKNGLPTWLSESRTIDATLRL